MSTHKSSSWCVVKKCNNNVMERRQFFLFPKEYDRYNLVLLIFLSIYNQFFKHVNSVIIINIMYIL
jgi:hypothetical protein